MELYATDTAAATANFVCLQRIFLILEIIISLRAMRPDMDSLLNFRSIHMPTIQKYYKECAVSEGC